MRRSSCAEGALWQTEQRPPRRSLLRPVRPRVLLPPPPPLHAVLVCRESCFVYVYVVCRAVYGRCGLMSHLSLYHYL